MVPATLQRNERMKPGERVFITGLGIVTAIGKTIPEFADALRTGRSGIKNLDKDIFKELEIKIGAELTGFRFAEQLNASAGAPENALEECIQRALKSATRSSMGIQAGVACVIEALAQSGIHVSARETLSQRCGLIVAGNNLSSELAFVSQKAFEKNPRYLNPRFVLHALDTDYVGTISEIIGLHGEGFTIGGASASGNVALIKAFHQIRAGLLDACIVVGAPAFLSPLWMQGFGSIGAMGGKRFKDAPEKACRPFDRDHEGFIYGEGGGCLILESGSLARSRKGKALAEVLGGAIRLDGNRLSDPNVQGEIAAMEAALKDAGKTPRDIDYINAHGSSSPLGDETEVMAIKAVFAEPQNRPWINSTKGLTGHCLTSAGVIEAIATVIQMQRGFVHPNLNLDNPIDDRCRFCPSVTTEAVLQVAMSNSFGFGGINTSIVFETC